MPRPRLVFLLVLGFLLSGAATARAQVAVPHRALSAVRTPEPAHLRPPAVSRPVRLALEASVRPPLGRRAELRVSLRPTPWLTGAAGVTWGPRGPFGRLEFRVPVF